MLSPRLILLDTPQRDARMGSVGCWGWGMWWRMVYLQLKSSAPAATWQQQVTARHLANGSVPKKVLQGVLLEPVTPKPWRDVPLQCLCR